MAIKKLFLYINEIRRKSSLIQIKLVPIFYDILFF